MSGSDVVRAQLADGPWGPLLGALAARGFTGEVTLDAGGKHHAIELRRGAVIGASSPLASDAIVRIALTGHLITAMHIATLTRALVAAPKRDEVEVVAEVARLSPEQAHTLRARAITQRAARTFALDTGDVTIRAGVARPSALEIEMAAVVFLGARMNLSEVRLANDLRRFGARFALAADAEARLPRFGFGADAVAIANALRASAASVAELEATHRDVDPRVTAATVYALVSCGAAIATEASRATGTAESAPLASPPMLAVSRTMTPVAVARTRSDQMTARELPVVRRAPTDLAVPTADLAVPRAPTTPLAVARTSSPVFSRAITTPRTPTARPVVPRTVTPRWTPDALVELEAVVSSRLALIDHGADYFSVLGLVLDAPIDAVRAAHAQLARALQPEELARVATPELRAAAARLRDHITDAVTVLGDPARRGAYVAALHRGGDPLLRIPRTRTEEERSPLDEALHRGMLALRANQPERAAVELARACELEPGNIDHAVLLAWARFCAATDKAAAAHDARKILQAALRQSNRPELAYFYLGRVERMLGRDREALTHFLEAVDRDPANLEAAAEIRVLEARLASARRK